MLAVAAAFILLAFPAQALATYPGANGKIAFTISTGSGNDIFLGHYPESGTAGTRLTTTGNNSVPNWSPDGTRIAFVSERDGNRNIYIMNPDGSGQTRLTSAPANEGSPTWSPDGTKIAFVSGGDIYTMNPDGSNQTLMIDPQPGAGSVEWSPKGDKFLVGNRVMNLDGTGVVYLESGYWHQPPHLIVTKEDWGFTWSPDGEKIIFVHYEDDYEFDFWYDVHTIKPDGSDERSLFPGVSGIFIGSPAWSPDGQKVAVSDSSIYWVDVSTGSSNGYAEGFFYNNHPDSSLDPDWQPLAPSGYARPKGASPINVRLVPAYEACTSPNAEHGAPLSVSSCSPPVEDSGHATTGHGDGHPTAAKFTGIVTLREVGENPIDPSNGDQADVQVIASITDVRNPDFTEYAGELRVSPAFRITDRQSGGQFSPPIHPATAVDTPLGFTLTCSSTSDTTIGSACSATTTADAVLPGVVREGKRSVWGLGEVEVYDGGADGDADTTGDNTLFATQGLFVP